MPTFRITVSCTVDDEDTDIETVKDLEKLLLFEQNGQLQLTNRYFGFDVVLYNITKAT